MSPTAVGLVGLASLFALLPSGMPIGLVLLLVGILGYAVLNGIGPALAMLGSAPFEHAYNYELSVIPLFVLMGNFAVASGLSSSLFSAANALVGRYRGGLGMATILGCSGFAAVSGSSLAAAVTMGKVSLPEMRRHNYDDRLATGCIAAGGTLGILIPPSTAMMVYALITEQSIGQLFLAGVLPGLLLTALFVLTIMLLTAWRPELGPAAAAVGGATRRRILMDASGMVAIIMVVLGGIYVGAFTPTEAAGVGAFATMVLALARRGLGLETTIRCLVDTVQTTAMVFLIMIGAQVFSPFLALTRIPADLSSFVVALQMPPLAVLAVILFGYIILGMFLEGFAMMVLTLPIVFPLVTGLGYDPIWFGILMVVVLEMSLISPPVGLNVFVVKGIAPEVPLNRIFAGIAPFWIAMLLCLCLLILFPQIALMLPGRMS